MAAAKGDALVVKMDKILAAERGNDLDVTSALMSAYSLVELTVLWLDVNLAVSMETR